MAVGSSDAVSAEEQAWWQEMLKKGYVEADKEDLIWTKSTHAKRQQFYADIQATEKAATAKAEKEEAEKAKVAEEDAKK